MKITPKKSLISALYILRFLKEYRCTLQYYLCSKIRTLKILTKNRRAAYLTDIATKYERLTTLSLQAKFGSDEVFDTERALRIAPAVSSRFTSFDQTMAQYGHEYLFSSSQAKVPEPAQEPALNDDWNQIEDSNAPTECSSSKVTNQTRTRMEPGGPEIDDMTEILDPGIILDAPKSDDIEVWLRDLYESGRGFELGTFDPSILATTMKKQSSKWTGISLGYVSDVIVIVHRFICKALDVTCYDGAMKATLMGVLFDGLYCRYKNAIEHVNFLLEVERNGTPLTTNHYFNDNLEKWSVIL